MRSKQGSFPWSAGAKEIPSSVAVTGKFFGFTSWQVGVGVAGAPLLVALLMLWFYGKFSAVPKEDFEQLQVKEQQVKVINAQVIIDGRYYKD